MKKTYRYTCYDKEGRITAIIFNEQIVVVKGDTYSKWMFELWTKDHIYLGAIYCEYYKYEEVNF